MLEIAYVLDHYLIWSTVILVLYLTYRIDKGKVLDFLLSIGLALVISEALKYMFNQPRPDATFEGSSFPSTHASVAFAVFFFYLLCVRNPRYLKKVLKIGEDNLSNRKFAFSISVFVVLLSSVLVALLRVYISAHYLTDVIAGIFVGFISIIPFLFYDVSSRRVQ